MDEMDDMEGLEEIHCNECKNMFWVPYFEDKDLGAPEGCPFCMQRFVWYDVYEEE